MNDDCNEPVEISLVIESYDITEKKRKLKAIWSYEAAQDFAAVYNINKSEFIEGYLKDLEQFSIQQEQDKEQDKEYAEKYDKLRKLILQHQDLLTEAEKIMITAKNCDLEYLIEVANFIINLHSDIGLSND
jgi:superfamily II DNA or RNA helicase